MIRDQNDVNKQINEEQLTYLIFWRKHLVQYKEGRIKKEYKEIIYLCYKFLLLLQILI